jgi:hypothetical protein
MKLFSSSLSQLGARALANLNFACKQRNHSVFANVQSLRKGRFAPSPAFGALAQNGRHSYRNHQPRAERRDELPAANLKPIEWAFSELVPFGLCELAFLPYRTHFAS